MWDFFWIILWSAVFVGYVFAVLYVLKDLFTDPVLSGWAKAAWVLALILVPFLTLLVYMIVRSDSLNMRAFSDGYRDRVIADSDPVPSATPAADIARAKELLDSGTITQGEYDAIKSKALGNKF